MKIVCDNCSAKYQISDDKVRNKTFKIRCKKCSHIIVVRAGEQDAAASEPDDVQEPQPQAAAEPAVAAAPQAAPDAIWHVVINREQVGPLSPPQVEAYFQSGDIDAETFIWAEGMADWSRLGSVPQFAHLAPAAPAAAPAAAAVAAAAPMAAAAAEPAPSGGGMFPSEDDDVIASNNVADATARAPSSMFPDEEEPAGPRISTASQLRNQRNENSVLFSLDTLAAEAENRRARPAAASANTGGSEASGLIDITALGGLDVGGGRAGDDPFGGTGGMAPAPLTAAAPVQPLVAPASGGKTGLIVAIVLGVLLLVGGAATAMYFVMKKDDTGQPVATANEPAPPTKVALGTPPPAEKPAAAAPAAEEKPAADEKAGDGAEEGGEEGGDTADEAEGNDEKAAPARRAARRTARRTATQRTAAKTEPEKAAAPAAKPEPARRAPSRPKKESTDEVDALLGALDGSGGGSKPAATRSAGAATPAPSGGGSDPMLPDSLSRRQILTVVKRNARSIQGCKSGTDASGNVIVDMVIGQSGRVTSATTQGEHSGTPVGSCVERKVRAFRFPQFSGEPMRIKMPFSL